MAFFDDLSKKLSQVGQSAVQKTKEVADIAKYTASIAEEERNITKLYAQIGQAYVQLHAEDAPEDMKELIQQIWAAQEKIQENRAQLRQLKGVELCPNCEAEVDKDALFCGKCGAKMPEPPAPVVVEPEEAPVEEAPDEPVEEVVHEGEVVEE